MPVISKEMDQKVLQGLVHYGEYKVARMYNLRVTAVRAIKLESLTGTQRLKDSQLSLDMGHFIKPTTKAEHVPNYQPEVGSYDYGALEQRMLAHMTNSTGHALLDMLNQHEIYNPEQLAYALNFDQRIEDHINSLTTEGKLLLLRQLSKGLYEQHINSGSTKPAV